MNKTEIIIIVILAVIILLLIFLPGKAKASAPSESSEPSTGDEITPHPSLPPEYNVVPTTAQKIKIINPEGMYAFDFGPEGCMNERKDFIPAGTIMQIIEVKPNFSKCLEPLSMTIVRTSKGWFSLNPIIIKIV